MKKTVYIRDSLARLLEGHQNASRRIEIIATCYQEIVKHHCPVLSEAQWCAICDVCKKHQPSPTDSPRIILHLLADEDEFNDLGKKWSVSVPDLHEAIKANGIAGMVAAFEVGQQFWLTETAKQEFGFGQEDCDKERLLSSLLSAGACLAP